MNTGNKLSTWGCISIIALACINQLLLSFPNIASTEYGTALALNMIYTTIITLIFLSIIFKLYKAFESQDILDISEFLGGKTLKLITGLLLIFFLFVTLGIVMREFSENLKNVAYTSSPIEYISLIFVIGMLVGSYFGIRSLVRLSGIVFPIVIISIAFIIFSVLEDMNFTNLLPVLGNGTTSVFLHGALDVGRFEAIIILFLIPPFVQNNLKKIGYSSVLLASLCLTLTLVALLTLIPYPTVTENYFPIFEVTRLINYGRFFQRAESIFILIWIWVNFLALSFGLSLIELILKKVFHLKYSKVLIPILTVIMFSVGYPLNSIFEILKYRTISYHFITPILVFIYPLIILILANIKNKIYSKKQMEVTHETA